MTTTRQEIIDDILDDRESLTTAFVGAVCVHAALIGGLAAIALMRGHTDPFGDKNAGAGSVGVMAVDSIPLIHKGAPNPLANNTESEVPQTPVKEIVKKAKAVEPPPPDAIKIKDKKAPPPKQVAQVTQPTNRFRSFKELDPNQMTSKTAPAVSNPMYSPAAGGGQVGVMNTTLGDRFAAYAAQIRQILAQTWRTGDVDSWRSSAPPVVATFDLMRDGSVRNMRIAQRSGVATLDASVERAIQDAHFPPIPPGFEKESANVQFTFELKR